LETRFRKETSLVVKMGSESSPEIMRVSAERYFWCSKLDWRSSITIARHLYCVAGYTVRVTRVAIIGYHGLQLDRWKNHSMFRCGKRIGSYQLCEWVVLAESGSYLII
jgi:hypothetical protein